MNRKTKNRRKRKKIVGLFAITGVTAVALVVGTYAWFVGLSSVSVSEFEIGVSTAKNLYLSLDGVHWDESLTITEAGVTHTGSDSTNANEAYNGNTNKWVDSDGLIPLSTDGAIDSTYSRLKLYTKSSITATKGGYRIMASRITNYGDAVAEQKGYVAFDLFVKNGSTGDYTVAYNAADDEAVYLTTDSSVIAVPEGDDDDYGLANSVRVAFVQIGRVSSATDTAATVQGITCTSDTNVTGLCANVTPTIWEPNDASHNSNLVTYFNTVCKKKTVATGNVISYAEGDNSTCTPADENTALGTTTPVSTYVVNRDIASSDKVDVYDGLNGYDFSSVSGYGLSLSNTFTDTMKAMTNSDRPAFMYLAANSITKIRVYIYLEGQDVDNYDLVSNGKKIKVKFGFTKDQLDQLTEDDS